ncbi:phage portal protein [Terasakiella sp.]|uniref:phage portal protein n=1 Tax=Terasakiella sp. TaxID=2034861 RepID=UPI003AA920FE
MSDQKTPNFLKRVFGRGEPAAEPVKIEPNLKSANRNRVHSTNRTLRMLEAAKSNRLTSDWSTQAITGDELVRRNYLPLVARSREQAANNDYAKKFLRLCTQNIVGPKGVQLQAQSRDTTGSLDVAANEAIEKAWADWSKRENCDITGRKNLRNVAVSLVNSAAKDGEYMVRMVFGKKAGPHGFALQVLDPLLCPAHLDQEKLPGGNFIRHGIEFNSFGRPQAYLFKTLKADQSHYSFHGTNYIRVPADEIIHDFLEDVVGQKRGLPWMATGLWRLRMLGKFEDASLVNARVSSEKSGFFEWEEGLGPEKDDDEEVFIESEAGTFQELPAGLRFKEWNPQYPSGEFAVFQKAMLRGTAAGFGVAYNNLANDLEGVNFSSIRQGTLDEREHWKMLQEWLIEGFYARVFDQWLPRALLGGITMTNGGKLRAERIDKYAAVSWQPRRWQWIDPNAEVKAAVASKDNLLASPSQIIRESGQDPDAVWRQIGSDIQSMKKAGIPDNFIQAALKLKPEGGGGDDAPNKPESGGGENDT